MTDLRQTSFISYGLATRLLAEAVKSADARDVALGFAILDSSGHLVASGRMDGAAFITVEIARGKAFACAAAGGLSGESLSQIHTRDPVVWSGIAQLGFGAPILAARGSLPIFIDGAFVGVIGSSGAPVDIDEAVLLEAIRSIGGSPER